MTLPPQPESVLVGVKSSIRSNVILFPISESPAEKIRLSGYLGLSVAIHLLTFFFAFNAPAFLSSQKDTSQQLLVVLKSSKQNGDLRTEEKILDFDLLKVDHPIPDGSNQLPQQHRVLAARSPSLDSSSRAAPSSQRELSSVAPLLEQTLNHEISQKPEYQALGLDPPPRPLHDIEPEYPTQRGLREGVVVLRLLINEKGLVDDVTVIRSLPPGMFDTSAITAFGNARFSPGMFLGLPVKSQMTVEVEFMPTNRGPAVSGSSH